jgi:Tfp pilus assembly protein PilO
MKVVMAVFVILLIAAGFWMVDWQKKTAELKQLSAALTQKNGELGHCKSMVSALPQENARKVKLERELKVCIHEQFTPENQQDIVPSAIADIESLVEHQKTRMGDRDFIISSLTPGAMQAAGAAKEGTSGVTVLKEYPRLTFQMALNGQYATVIDFLRQLGALKLKRLVTVNRLSLTPSGDAKPGMSPPLSIQMPITAYLRQGAVQ